MAQSAPRLRWDARRVREVLVMLKATGLFKNLDAAHGYDARRPITPHRVRTLKKLYTELRYTHDEVRPGEKFLLRKGGFAVDAVATRPMFTPAKTLAIAAPRTAKQAKVARDIVGLTSSYWKRVPFVALNGASKVRIEIDASRNRARMVYPDWALEQIIVRVPERRVISALDLQREESSTSDEYAQAYSDILRASMDDLRDDGFTFRLQTVYGQVASTGKYPATTDLDRITDEYIPTIINKYGISGGLSAGGAVQITGHPILTGVTATRRTGGKGEYPVPVSKNKNIRIARDAWRTENQNREVLDPYREKRNKASAARRARKKKRK